MINFSTKLQSYKIYVSRHGFICAFVGHVQRFLNKFFRFQSLNIIVLNRTNLKVLDPQRIKNFSTQFATLEDLQQLQRDQKWDITTTKIQNFHNGDFCLLSYIDGVLAGYSWAHIAGQPELIPGLTISIPEQFVYNYAGFTSPDYRGYGLQGYRHYELLNSKICRDKQGLLGYVDASNWSSRKGQTKSGYRKIGTIWIIGGDKHFLTFFSKNLKEIGIKRIHYHANK